MRLRPQARTESAPGAVLLVRFAVFAPEGVVLVGPGPLSLDGRRAGGRPRAA